MCYVELFIEQYVPYKEHVLQSHSTLTPFTEINFTLCVLTGSFCFSIFFSMFRFPFIFDVARLPKFQIVPLQSS